MNKKETIIQTALFLGFIGFTLGSFALVTIVYKAAPFGFFGIHSAVSLSLVTVTIAVVLLILLLVRRRKKRHYHWKY